MVNKADSGDVLQPERARLKEVYERRDQEIDRDLYAPWQAGEMLMVFERRRVASEMLVEQGRFPNRATKCLEIGYGKLGWMSDLIGWGVSERSVFGIELDEDRAAEARAKLPSANLMIGDASRMPCSDRAFDLVILSTVLSSISSDPVLKIMASEIARVLAPGGVVLVYDAAVPNPRNGDLRPVSLRQIQDLFPEHKVRSRSLTLAPPVARFIAPKSWTLATMLSAMPFFRTHRLTLLTRS